MFATLFFANRIHVDKDGDYIVRGLNNVFVIPFAPTLFSVDFTAIIGNIDRSIEHSLKVNLVNKQGESSTVLNTLVPADTYTEDIVSTTFNGSLVNTKIDSFGEYQVEVLVDGDLVGSSKIYFKKDPNV